MAIDPGLDSGASVETLAPLEPQILELPAPAAEQAEGPGIPPPAVAEVKPKRGRPRWAVPAAIAAVGLVASATLGYLDYSTSSKLDATRHQLTVTQLSLDSTSKQLAAADADAATRKVTADYVKMYTADAGKVRTDYGDVVACNSYATCRFAAQQALTDMQTFQSDRQSAAVPSTLSASDSALGDSLTASIAALQELISGMDGDSRTKIEDGFSKLDASMLSMAKAEAALGNELQ
jgi:hypothetical protein